MSDHEEAKEAVMAIDLKPLLARAFFVEKVRDATQSIERAREKYEQLAYAGALSLEYVVPPDPDEGWLRERLLRSVVYFCESEGRSLPRGAGVFISLFAGDSLYCLTVPELLAWADEALGLSVDELRTLYGTHELETTLR
jgi:hypothetical protein